MNRIQEQKLRAYIRNEAKKILKESESDKTELEVLHDDFEKEFNSLHEQYNDTVLEYAEFPESSNTQVSLERAQKHMNSFYAEMRKIK